MSPWCDDFAEFRYSSGNKSRSSEAEELCVSFTHIRQLQKETIGLLYNDFENVWNTRVFRHCYFGRAMA